MGAEQARTKQSGRRLPWRRLYGRVVLALIVASIALASCRAVAGGPLGEPTLPATSVHVPLILRWHEPTRYTYRVVSVYPHDRNAFTQGLVYHRGQLYESTGQQGRSDLRLVALETGQVLRSQALPHQYFGEGIALVDGESVHTDDRIIQLTWQSQVGFVYALETFKPVRTFSYPGEGWGLTYDGERLVMSDGTAWLRFWDPETLDELGRVLVQDRGRPVARLNELEYVEGLVYANVWQTDLIAVIAPETGQVTGWIDLAGLLPASDRDPPVDVLNGIAYDAAGERLYVTGKWWPKLFQIELVRLGAD